MDLFPHIFFKSQVGEKNGPLLTIFFQITKFYFNESLHEDSMPSKNFKNADMGSSLSHRHHNDVIAYPEQIGFGRKYILP